MKTKQEYIDTLVCITKEYYSTVRSPEEVNKFNSYLRLFEGLVDEHFEEKKETNYEHYKDEIIEGWMLDLALVDGKLKRCSRVDCDECEFNPGANKGCKQRLIEWVKKPYEKPKYELSRFEYDLLQLYKGKYSFKLSNSLRGMKEKGYFRSVDENAKIEDILESCEVIK